MTTAKKKKELQPTQLTISDFMSLQSHRINVIFQRFSLKNNIINNLGTDIFFTCVEAYKASYKPHSKHLMLLATSILVVNVKMRGGRFFTVGKNSKFLEEISYDLAEDLTSDAIKGKKSYQFQSLPNRNTKFEGGKICLNIPQGNCHELKYGHIIDKFSEGFIDFYNKLFKENATKYEKRSPCNDSNLCTKCKYWYEISKSTIDLSTDRIDENEIDCMKHIPGNYMSSVFENSNMYTFLTKSQIQSIVESGSHFGITYPIAIRLNHLKDNKRLKRQELLTNRYRKRKMLDFEQNPQSTKTVLPQKEVHSQSSKPSTLLKTTENCRKRNKSVSFGTITNIEEENHEDDEVTYISVENAVIA
mmetsp:Transcript_2748/g.3908  ORF Transcript_2748/g.3908 Transcript_2748/m.3908 type:complete len:360 (+) Transcript_2748:85-1164(+)